MPMENPLAGPRLKIERANKHIGDLESLLERWFQGDPYEVVKEKEADGRGWVFKLSRCAEVPPEIRAVTGDAVHNLRSSLDYLVDAAIRANGHTPTDRTMFPICNSAKAFEAKLSGVETVGQDALDLLEATHAYKGGNDGLWALRELDNADKHRLLIMVASRYGSFGFNLAGMMRRAFESNRDAIEAAGGSVPAEFPTPPEFNIVPDERQFPLEVGSELLRLPADATQDDDPVNFSFDVAFGEPSVLEGESIFPALTQIRDVVSGVIEGFAPLFD
jgi:hypothetical protein